MTVTQEYDFTQGATGDPFPGEAWGYGIIVNPTASPVIIGEDDPSPFYLQDGLALFQNRIDAVGGDTHLRGAVASPSFPGTSAITTSITFANPLQYFSYQDEFSVRLVLGVLAENNLMDFVGGMIESKYASGVWQDALKISLVQYANLIPSIFSTKNLDLSFFAQSNQLSVTHEDRNLSMSFNGHTTLSTTLSSPPGGQAVVMWVEVTSTQGATVTPHPLISLLTASSLSSEHLTPVYEMPTQAIGMPVSEAHFYRVPVAMLMDGGVLEQIAASQWRFTQDVDVTDEWGRTFAASKGDVIAAPRVLLEDAYYQDCKFIYN